MNQVALVIMEESNACDPVPDLKDLELKVGRKTPEGLLKWMREDHKTVVFHQTDNNESEEKKGLDEKIRKLRLEMAHLRAADVKILNQLLALHEGIESVKWLLEERGTLTSHCSSLTSSQFSLVEGPDTSWRGSWSSLQDPHDKLDNISIGSYLDTLADDLDEYCPSSGTDSIICANAEVSRAAGGGVSSFTGSPQVKQDVATEDTAVWNKVASDSGRPSHQNKPNGVLKDSPGAGLAEKLGKNQSSKAKHYKNGLELDSCKMNGKVQAEFDAHWHWVQSQDDVTFL